MDYVEDRISGLEDKVKELDHSVKINDDKLQKPYKWNMQNLQDPVLRQNSLIMKTEEEFHAN